MRVKSELKRNENETISQNHSLCFGFGINGGLHPKSQSTAVITTAPTKQIPTNTLAPTLPATVLPTIQPKQTTQPEPTPTPFLGFAQNFKFYQAWTKKETTWFYFMNAYIDQTIYALVDDLEGNSYALICPPDETYPQDLRCYSEELFKGKREYKVTFTQTSNINILFMNKSCLQIGYDLSDL